MSAVVRLGVLGGTFDPIHLGHTGTAEAAHAALRLDHVVFIPSRVPPHRAQQPSASRYHRFAMAALAVNGRPQYTVSDMEVLAAGPSFTADTLERLHATGRPAAQIFFITGADAFAEIASWHRFPEVLDLAHFVVVSRPGHDALEVVRGIPAAAARAAGPGDEEGRGGRVYAVRTRTPDVSSTEVRRRLRTGEPVTALIDAAVDTHIRQHRLYKGDASSSLAPSPADHLHGQD